MSSSLEPDESLTPSVTTESITSGLANSKKRSPIWAHCRLPNQDENQTFLYCVYCVRDETPPPYGTTSSANMGKHIKKHHPEVIIEKALSKTQEAVKRQLRQLYHQAETTGEAEEFDLEILEASLNTTVLTEALISLIVVRNLSYAMVEWPEFHTFC